MLKFQIYADFFAKYAVKFCELLIFLEWQNLLL